MKFYPGLLVIISLFLIGCEKENNTKNEEEHFRFDAEILLYEPSYGVLDLNPIVKNFTYQVTNGDAGENIELPKANYETMLKDLKHKNGFAMAVYEFSVEYTI
ncbi:MAG: hypothetical protein WBM77_10010 [Maribacter sp.]